MSQDIQEIQRSLREYEDTPESWGLELRLNLAEIVISALRRKGWRQGDLAHAASMKDSFISRVLHSNANCTLDTVGKLFHALGVNARITAEVGAVGVPWRIHTAVGEIQILDREETGDAPSISASESSTEERWQVRQANTGA